MVLSQAVACRTIRIHDTAIAVKCPKCKTCSKFIGPTVPHIDSCGFEYHSFRCECCASLLAGIIDPSDGELVVSLLEEPSGVTAIPPSDLLSDHNDPRYDTRLHGTEGQSSTERD
jgi:hypothetical protein